MMVTGSIRFDVLAAVLMKVKVSGMLYAVLSL